MLNIKILIFSIFIFIKHYYFFLACVRGCKTL